MGSAPACALSRVSSCSCPTCPPSRLTRASNKAPSGRLNKAVAGAKGAMKKAPHTQPETDASEDDWAAIMAEPPEGFNSPSDTSEFLANGGWHAVSIKDSGEEGGGLTSHRGAVSEEEFVDPEVMRFSIEARLGFTVEEVHSVYRQGPLSPEQRALRDRIDLRIYEVWHEGGNMVLLGRALGLAIRERENDCQALKGAVARAREAGA